MKPTTSLLVIIPLLLGACTGLKPLPPLPAFPVSSSYAPEPVTTATPAVTKKGTATPEPAKKKPRFEEPAAGSAGGTPVSKFTEPTDTVPKKAATFEEPSDTKK